MDEQQYHRPRERWKHMSLHRGVRVKEEHLEIEDILDKKHVTNDFTKNWFVNSHSYTFYIK